MNVVAIHGRVRDIRPRDRNPTACDWGGCDAPSEKMRHSLSHGWLFVCLPCSLLPEEREPVHPIPLRKYRTR
jgi:hypothetical protein